MAIYSNIKSNVLILFLALIAIFIAVYTSFLIEFFLIFSIIFFLALLLINNKIHHTAVLIPFIAISFMPGQYTGAFRFSSPLGEVRPDFLLILVVMIFFVIVNFNKIDLTSLSLYKNTLLVNFLFFCVSVLSILVNRLPMDNFRYSLFIFIFSFGFMLISALSRKLIDPVEILKSLIIISTIVCIIGILEFLNIYRPYTALYVADNPWFSYVPGTDNLRIASSIGNPLVLSGYLLLMLPVVLFIRENAHNKTLWNFTLALHLLTLLLTQSRSAYIVMLITILYYSARNFKSLVLHTSLVSFVLALFYFILSVFGGSQTFIDRLLFKAQGESYSIRTEAFSVAYQLLQEKFYLLIGLGPNMVNANLTNRFSPVTTLDNVFLMTLVSVGIVGLIVFISIFVILGSIFSKMHKDIKRIGYSLLIVIIGMGFSFNITYFTSVWGVFWLLVSILIIYNLKLNEENKGENLSVRK